MYTIDTRILVLDSPNNSRYSLVFIILNILQSMSSVVRQTIKKLKKKQLPEELEDIIIAERPLQIMIGFYKDGQHQRTPLAATMRTPGDDFNLVAGWLFAEGIVASANDLIQIQFLGNEDTVLAELSPTVAFNPKDHQRQFPITSACGWCGRDHLDNEAPVVLPQTLSASETLIMSLPGILREGQGLFSSTGGAHAIALVNQSGEVIIRGEDVGRHNAMDKVLGAMLRSKQMPLHNYVAIFSGRLGYELAQKSLVAGIQIICSIGAPSSAALELADAYGMTVCGFVREDGFNLYCGANRIKEA